MTHGIYMTDLPGTTLSDVLNETDKDLTIWGGGAHQISLNLEADEPTIMLGAHEVPATTVGQIGLARHFEIPAKFFERLEKDERQWLLGSRMAYLGGDLTVAYDEKGIKEVFQDSAARIRPHRLVERALAVFPEQSPVVDWWCTPDELRVDVIVPEGYERYVGGDPSRGDLTRGGVRFGQDRKNNLAPWVQPLTYRLVCTNGMEVPDAGIKIDTNMGHATAEEIEAMFEVEMRRAVDRLEEDIQHFYSLREQRVEDPTGTLRRMALEQGLPERTIGRLEDMLPAVVEGDATMFDLVNIMTNMANNPAINRRSSSRRNLQRAGGGVVHDHAARCNTCHSRLR